MKKILIIDDDKTFRIILKETLIKEGYYMLEANSGEKGLEMVKSEHPDLVITDFQMPGLSGLDVLQAIIKMKTGIPVIMITGFSDTENIIKAIQMGAFDYLEKPVNPSVLKSAIKIALNSANLSSNLDMVVNDELYSSNVTEENILVGNTPPMKEVFKKIGCISLNKVNVLILGDTGTGKELIARLIHSTGVTKDQPLVTVNCSALAESLLESELFGHVKGSFTGAIRDKKGKFELAGEGSILLDEISEISLNTQVKLLRVIQELEFEKVGGEATIPMKARIIAASNRNLEELIKEGKFREDLYYRLKVFTIQIPPLRDRKDDIGGLVIHFLRKLNKKFNRNVVKIGEGVIDMLKEHDWYGNVRELENTLLQAIVVSKSDVLQKENIMLNFRNPSENSEGEKMPNLKSLSDVEAYHIKKILDQTKWNRVESSHILDISRPTLNAKIEKYHLEQN
jgi:DNA-binding NtrC family response regulator